MGTIVSPPRVETSCPRNFFSGTWNVSETGHSLYRGVLVASSLGRVRSGRKICKTAHCVPLESGQRTAGFPN